MRPSLELLEDRLTPSSFTNADHNNQWLDLNNWDDGKIPGIQSSVAEFPSIASGVIQGGTPATLSTLILDQGTGIKIPLSQTLDLNQLIMHGGEVYAGTAGADLNLDGWDLNNYPVPTGLVSLWDAGTIGFNWNAPMKLNVVHNDTLNIGGGQLLPAVNLGADVYIGKEAVANTACTVNVISADVGVWGFVNSIHIGPLSTMGFGNNQATPQGCSVHLVQTGGNNAYFDDGGTMAAYAPYLGNGQVTSHNLSIGVSMSPGSKFFVESHNSVMVTRANARRTDGSLDFACFGGQVSIGPATANDTDGNATLAFGSTVPNFNPASYLLVYGPNNILQGYEGFSSYGSITIQGTLRLSLSSTNNSWEQTTLAVRNVSSFTFAGTATFTLYGFLDSNAPGGTNCYYDKLTVYGTVWVYDGLTWNPFWAGISNHDTWRTSANFSGSVSANSMQAAASSINVVQNDPTYPGDGYGSWSVVPWLSNGTIDTVWTGNAI